MGENLISISRGRSSKTIDKTIKKGLEMIYLQI